MGSHMQNDEELAIAPIEEIGDSNKVDNGNNGKKMKMGDITTEDAGTAITTITIPMATNDSDGTIGMATTVEVVK